jgi:hypothetical protein
MDKRREFFHFHLHSLQRLDHIHVDRLYKPHESLQALSAVSGPF